MQFIVTVAWNGVSTVRIESADIEAAKARARQIVLPQLGELVTDDCCYCIDVTPVQKNSNALIPEAQLVPAIQGDQHR